MSFEKIHPPLVQSTDDQQQSHSNSDSGSAQQPEHPDTLNNLAKLILSDCGRSTNDERLLATVVSRLASRIKPSVVQSASSNATHLGWMCDTLGEWEFSEHQECEHCIPVKNTLPLSDVALNSLSALKPATQESIKSWLADGTFVERSIGTMLEQERENMRLEKQVSTSHLKSKPAQQEVVVLVHEPDAWRVRLPRWTAPGIWNPMPTSPQQQSDMDYWKAQEGATIEYAAVIPTPPAAPVQCSACNGMGISDGVGDKCQKCCGEGIAIQGPPICPDRIYPLHDDLYDSKDWRDADYFGRVEWLHSMYESKKRELNSFLEQAINHTLIWLDIDSAPTDGTEFIGWDGGAFIAIASRVPRNDCDMWRFGNTTADASINSWVKPRFWLPREVLPLKTPEACQ
jgi:hypothetical protein